MGRERRIIKEKVGRGEAEIERGVKRRDNHRLR